MNYFYDKTVEIISESTGITDDYGLYHKGEETTIDTIPSDVQPYSTELLKKEYGQSKDVEFCSASFLYCGI